MAVSSISRSSYYKKNEKFKECLRGLETKQCPSVTLVCFTLSLTALIILIFQNAKSTIVEFSIWLNKQRKFILHRNASQYNKYLLHCTPSSAGNGLRETLNQFFIIQDFQSVCHLALQKQVGREPKLKASDLNACFQI